MIKKYLPIILILLVNICYANDKVRSEEKDSVIAKIGKDYRITFNDLSKYVVQWQYNLKYRNKDLAYKIALDSLIKNQLKRFDFFERGLEKNEDLIKSIRRTINEELTVNYYDKNYVEKYANYNSASEAYKVMDKEVVYYQIVLPTHGAEKKEKLDSLQSIAMKIQTELNKAKNVIGIIKKYSDKNTNTDNPKIVKWEQSLSDPIGNVVYNLRKGFTRVIHTSDGFYIVKISDIKRISLEPYEKIKNDIVAKLKDGYIDLYHKDYETFKNGSVDESTLKWNDKVLEKIAAWSNLPRFYYGEYRDTLQNILKSGINYEILSYNNGTVDLKEFLRLLEEVVIMNAGEKINVANVKSFILEALRSDYVIKKAKELDIEKNIFNPYTKNSVLKQMIAILYNKVVVEDNIPAATEDALHKFYTEQKDSIFYQLKKINIYARIYSDSTKAANEIKAINAGTPFEKISNSWFNKSFIRERNGKLKSYFSQEPPYLAEAAFKLGLNEVAGPIGYYDTENGKQYAVIKCDEVRPEKQLSYDEVKKTIKEKFINYYRQKLSEKVEKDLRNKYQVEIYQGNLMELLSAEE
jgi:hypothetical protein